jgi:hypothetical protein
MGKFNHLNVPNQWQHYWTKYPEGYTILEALLNWVAQVDNMVDNQNQLNDTVTSYGNRLDDFIEQFDDNLQTEVTEVLTEWQQSGFLDVVISEALQTEIDTVKADLAQIEQDKADKTELETTNERTYLGIENGGRSTITYKDGNSVYVSGKTFVLSGFRFRGQYLKGQSKIVEFPNHRQTASVNTNLGAQTTKDFNNWYATFAVLENGEPKIKVMPFFSVQSVYGQTITFSDAGENRDVNMVKQYNLPNGVLTGSDVLVITERLGTNAHNSHSGRIAKATDNTNISVTIDDIGTIGQGDWLLVAPPNCEEYRYLGTFFVDTQEVRNIADSGTIVKTRGVKENKVNIDGDISTGVTVDFGGLINPLATSAIFYIRENLSTTSTGTHNLTIGMDDSHDYDALFSRKLYDSTFSVIHNGIITPFLFGQRIVLKSSGTLQQVATREIHIRGWIEA